MRLNKELARRILMGADEGNRFYCDNGKFFSTLSDLKSGLKIMSDEVFLHHTAEGRNDFSNWIRDCLGDARLADALIGLNKENTLKKIEARIVYIEKYLEKKI